MLKYMVYVTNISMSYKTGGTSAIHQNIFVNHVLTDRFVHCMRCGHFDIFWRYLLQIFHVSNNLQIYKQVLQIFSKVRTESMLYCNAVLSKLRLKLAFLLNLSYH
jgi:hypothetical protein